MTTSPSSFAGAFSPEGAGEGRPPSSALVTGAARGLGFSIASALAHRGDRVVLTDFDEVEVAAAAGRLRDEGFDVHSDRLDVSEESSVIEVIRRWDTALELTTIVANAGVASSSSIVDTSAAEFDRVMAVNSRGTFLTLREAARAMRPRGHGNVVAVASTSSFTASTSPMLAYDSSKAAVRMMTMVAARELAPSGVRVNAVAPGLMNTRLVRDLRAGIDEEDSPAGARIPLGRPASTDEVANAVVFLSSPEASYITGHTLVVDGGWLT